MWDGGKHEPMITEAEYDKVQALLGRKGNPRPKTHFDFAFTGLMRCGSCGSMVTAEEKHQVICGNCRFKFAHRSRHSCPKCQTPIAEMVRPVLLQYTYYHCSRSQNPRCPEKSLSGEKMEKQIDAYLARIQISERFKAWAVKYLHELYDKEIESRTSIIEAQQNAYNDCLRRIDNLVKLKTSPGNAEGSLLSDEEYGRQRLTLLKEKSSLEELLRDAGHRVERWVTLAEEIFEFACEVRKRFATGDTKTKKQILATIGSNLILKGKILRIEAKKPFFILEESLSHEKSENRTIEPDNIVVAQGRNRADDPDRPRGLGGLHDVRTLERSLGRQYQKLVKEVYMFFELRSRCPCQNCRSDFFDTKGRLEKKPRRWNSPPDPEDACMLSAPRNSLN